MEVSNSLIHSFIQQAFTESPLWARAYSKCQGYRYDMTQEILVYKLIHACLQPILSLSPSLVKDLGLPSIKGKPLSQLTVEEAKEP